MKGFSFFPQLVFGLIAFVIAVNVIPQLLAPYLPAIFIIISLMVAAAFMSRRARNRSKR